MVGDDESERQDLAAWRKYRTGARSEYDSIKRDARGFPLFVRATTLSKDWDQNRDTKSSSKFETVVGGLHNDQQLDDIFSAPLINSDVVSSKSIADASPSSHLDTPDRGKSVASFYSQLPRDGAENIQMPQTGWSRPQRISKIAQSARKSNSDWFIRKASAQLRSQKVEEDRNISVPTVQPGTSSVQSCSVCSSPLSSPLSTSEWEAHRLSIAHQLAVDGPAQHLPFPAESRAAERNGKEGEKGRKGNLVIKPSNVGFTALERMGWRTGMGLGRLEWEYGLRTGRFQITSLQGGESREGREAAIVISDSEEDEDEDLRFEIGTEQWLASVRKGQAHLAASKPTESTMDEGGIDSEKKEQSPLHERPLLEPIPVHLRPDRRGIGKSLPPSSRIVDTTTDRQRILKVQREKRSQRMTKSRRKDLERQEREEWKQIRSSLN